MTSRRLIRLRIALLLGGAALALAAAEMVLRARGYFPWIDFDRGAIEPVMHQPDATLGWRIKPGHYVAGPFSPGGPTAELTFLPDGSRRTSATPAPAGAPLLAFIGCSFTQGWAISDPETFAWRVQERFPDWHVLNLGTAGYGTYQSLLRLEELFASGARPRIVVYGLIDNHEMRNVATPLWLRMQAVFARRATIDVPYVTLAADGSLERHAPTHHVHWPLARQSALVALLEARFAEWNGRDRAPQGRAATEQLLLEMDALTRRNGAHLVVTLLYLAPAAADAAAQYASFATAHDIDLIDCVLPNADPKKYTVRGDWHPNGALNAHWADCIANRLTPLVSPP